VSLEDPRQRAEAWFRQHGLPYFVDEVRAGVRGRLTRARVLLALGISVLIGTAAGVGAGVFAAADRGSAGFSTGLTVALLALSAYGLRALRTAEIARWALGRAVSSLNLLVRLATRALPMLLLFITFLFINTEVWQVADAMSAGVLASSVLFFGLAATFFLVARLGEQLDEVDDMIDSAELADACQGTPLESVARDLAIQRPHLDQDVSVTGLERANLVLALVVAQAVQVLLLAVAVTAFFVLFGTVAIDPGVVESWLGKPPGDLLFGVGSAPLTKVAIFLGAFSGLYFTVYAVTDAHYREQFFTEILTELERAVGMRAVYRWLDTGADSD
jgi:hypothetical protein